MWLWCHWKKCTVWELCCSGAILCLTLCNPHELQHTRLLCLSTSPWVCSNSCPLNQGCHTTISFSVTPFSSCLQSFPAWGSFPMSHLSTSGGQNIGASASGDQWLLGGWLAPRLTVTPEQRVNPRAVKGSCEPEVLYVINNITSSLPQLPFPATLVGPLSWLLAARWPTPKSQLRFKQVQQTPTVGQPGHQVCHPAVLSGRRACQLIRTGQNTVHWRMEWQTTSVFLPWESHERMKRQKESCELSVFWGKIPRYSLASNS